MKVKNQFAKAMTPVSNHKDPKKLLKKKRRLKDRPSKMPKPLRSQSNTS